MNGTISTLFFSAWFSSIVRAVLHDPVRYPEPDSFKPERFINPDGSLRDDPVVSIIFGLGKRLCPGRHLADAIFFMIVASFLSVFNIKGDGTDGGPDKYPFTGTGVRYGHRVLLVMMQETRRAHCWYPLLSVPCPFAFSIVPRDRKAEELITANAEAQWATCVVMLYVSLVLHFFMTA
jgi:Cytochrome P450